MKKIPRFPKGTQQYLTFVGPRFGGIHPVIRSTPCTFLTVRFPKLVAINGNDQAAYRKAMTS